MANYNTVRTAETQPLGSIVPWVGGLTKVPPGWIVCNGQELQGNEYPLLARILKTAYGGTLSGNFPNYSGSFALPALSQKAFADISSEYFTTDQVTPGADQPTLNIDTAESLLVVGQYIGPEGNIGVPGTTNAVTDLNFTYTPDPDGTVENITFISGTAPDTTDPKFYSNLTPSGGNGTGALFNVIQNTDNTYQVSIAAKGESYEEGDQLTISGALITDGDVAGTSPANDIVIEVVTIGNPFFSGTITANADGDALEFVPGFDITTVNIVPRKLGRQHFPQHLHPDTYTTINVNDSTNNPGRGVTIFENPQIDIVEFFYGLNPATPNPFDGNNAIYLGNTLASGGNVWGDSQASGEITDVSNPFTPGVGRYALGSISGTPPANSHEPFNTGQAGHGIGKNWFTNAKKLRAPNNATSPTDAGLEKLRTTGKIDATTVIPFGDSSTAAGVINYDDGVNGSDDLVAPTQAMFNSNAISFTETTGNNAIVSHNHGGEFNVTYNPGSLTVPASIKCSVAANIIPDNLENAFQIEFNATSPSLTIITLIRAY